MTIPLSHKKERIHSIYVSAIMTESEHQLNVESVSDYGIDGIVHGLEIILGKYMNTGHVFQFQLKATKNCDKHSDEIAYDLSDSAHLKFVNWNGVIPMVLIVYCLPEDPSTYIQQDESGLTLSGCCYWRFMDDESLRMKRVAIPTSQVFNADAVSEILGEHKRALKELRS